MLIRIQDLKKEYSSFHLNCSLQVQEGSVVGLVGANGAGKTTTFKALLNLIDTDGGDIEIFDKHIHNLNVKDKQDIGVVLNDTGFSRYLNIKSIIPVLQAMYPNFDKASFIKDCERFNLPLKQKISQFSSGMQAKLKLLIALSHHPKLLILDEPTAGLDVVARDDLLDMLRSFMEDEQCGILISSHISSDLEGLCDELYMIHEGNIVLHEETDVLLDQYGIVKVDEKQFQELDKEHILRMKKESFGYKCLTNEKQYYLDNYPGIIVEKGSIDEMILMIVKGERL